MANLHSSAASLLASQQLHPPTMDDSHETMLNGMHHRADSYRYGSFSFANEEEDPFFVTHAKPDGLDLVKAKADEFIRFQKAKGRSVVIVTSGGSTVPLEVCYTNCGENALIIESNSSVYR
jgi:hypothetical protein